MRIAFITAGAAGMYCGSCMRDNTLTAALRELGHDAVLIPTYTPITTDEADNSQQRVFFGGITVYLRQYRLFRHTPGWVDRLLDRPRLLRWVARFAAKTPYSELGGLTLSMLRGVDGLQRKELAILVDFLKTEIKPDIVLLTNALLSGIVPTLRQALNVPVLVTLQGDDIFLDALTERDRKAAIEQIARNAKCVDGFISTSIDYADRMAEYFGIARNRIDVIPPGIKLTGHGFTPEFRPSTFTVGYFARVAPEKGFHLLVDAFIRLRQTPNAPPVRLKASGWLGENNRLYFDEQLRKLTAAGLADDFEYVPCPDHASKVKFLNSVDILSVPTTYREPKGLYVLEAWANGVPVVQPAHGAFPELLTATNGGLLVPPEDAAALADAIGRLAGDPALVRNHGDQGLKAVTTAYTARRMAVRTAELCERYVSVSRTPA